MFTVSHCTFSAELAVIILAAAGLGFPRLGVRPPMAEWGAMIAEGMPVIFDQSVGCG